MQGRNVKFLMIPKKYETMIGFLEKIHFKDIVNLEFLVNYNF